LTKRGVLAIISSWPARQGAARIVILGGGAVYVVVRLGGRQYRAEEGTQLLVEKLPQGTGEQVMLEEVLLVAGDDEVQVGAPLVEGAKVKATVVAHEKGPKIRVFKYRPKQRYRRRMGHRQTYTRLRVDEIVV
jgi:large subunit ribosomal protein L21